MALLLLTGNVNWLTQFRHRKQRWLTSPTYFSIIGLSPVEYHRSYYPTIANNLSANSPFIYVRSFLWKNSRQHRTIHKPTDRWTVIMTRLHHDYGCMCSITNKTATYLYNHWLTLKILDHADQLNSHCSLWRLRESCQALYQLTTSRLYLLTGQVLQFQGLFIHAFWLNWPVCPHECPWN